MRLFSVKIKSTITCLLIIVICFFSSAIYSQSIYTGTYGKYKFKYTLQINADSSVILTKTIKDQYSEYKGTIQSINDTLFRFSVSNSFNQCYCRAIGDSVMYVTADSSIRNTVKQISIIYSDNQTYTFPLTGDEIQIPINKKFYHPGKDTDFFYITAEYINPISHLEVKTRFDTGNEYCLELYKGQNHVFDVIIKNNRIKKTGKGGIDNFILTRQSAPAK